MARASGARDVLTNAQVFDSMEAAVADLHQVSLSIPSPPLSPPPSLFFYPPLPSPLALLTPTPSHSIAAPTWEEAVADLPNKVFCFLGGAAAVHPDAPPPPPQPRVTTATITTGVRHDGALARHDAEGGARRRRSNNSSGFGARKRRPPAQRLSLWARDERAGKRRPRTHGLHRAGMRERYEETHTGRQRDKETERGVGAVVLLRVRAGICACMRGVCVCARAVYVCGVCEVRGVCARCV